MRVMGIAATSHNFNVRPTRVCSSQRLGDKICIEKLNNASIVISYSRIPFRKSQNTAKRLHIQAALFDPPPFNPDKLFVRYLTGTSHTNTSPLPRRRYTLTHNDLTGSLQLSIGTDYNQDQLSGWYTQILRDEVLAEWHITSSSSSSSSPTSATLHVYCHVSGKERWPAPPALRSFIFQREMTLVLDTIAYAERDLLRENPALASAPIKVHLLSDMTSLNKIIAWGYLGDRSSWQKARNSSNVIDEMVDKIWSSLFGWMMYNNTSSNDSSNGDTSGGTNTGNSGDESGEESYSTLDANNDSSSGTGGGGFNSSSTAAAGTSSNSSRSRWTIAAAAPVQPSSSSSSPSASSSSPSSPQLSSSSSRIPSTASVGRRSRSSSEL